MPESSDFDKKRAELERRRADVRVSRLAAKVALLPAEAQERLELVAEAFLVAEDDEAARLKAAAEATPLDLDAVAAIAREILRRHPEEPQVTTEGALDSRNDRLSYAEFVELTGDMEFTLELLDGTPYVGGQPVEVAAFRQAMLLLQTRPATTESPDRE